MVFFRFYNTVFLKFYRFFVFTACMLSIKCVAQNMSIGIPAPDASALLHLSTTSKGLLIPRMTSTQRSFIKNPAKGLMVYETTTNRFYFNEGTEVVPAWRYLLTPNDLPALAGWQLLGNTGITSTHYIGTSDNTNLVLRANDQQVGIFRTSHTIKLGLDAGKLGSGSATIAIGRRAMPLFQGAPKIVVIGDSAMHYFVGSNTPNNTHFGNIVAIGAKAALKGTTSYEETVVVGYRGLAGDPGAGNTAIGNYALTSLDGSFSHGNTAVGIRALGNLTEGTENTAVGYEAGNKLTTGNFNSFLGYKADVPLGSGEINNASAIGYNSAVSTSNTMAFGNSSVKFWLFGQSGPNIGGAVFQVNMYTVGGINPYLSNTGTWTNTSDSSSKKDITAINEAELWEQVKVLPVNQWQYKGDTAKHIGPMAQDFKALLQVGDDDKAISTIDPGGVALATLQILIKKNKVLKARIELLEQKR